MGKSRNGKAAIVEFEGFAGRGARKGRVYQAYVGNILRMRPGRGGRASGPDAA